MKISIIGAGVSGCVAATLLANKGHSVDIYEKQNYVGGMCQTEKFDGTDIYVHKHGAHLFHTNFKEVYNLVKRYDTFIPYKHIVKSKIDGLIFNMPFNSSYYKHIYGEEMASVYNCVADEMKEYFSDRTIKQLSKIPRNFEESAILKFGVKFYEKYIKNYTEKDWGRRCSELPASIVDRLHFDNNDSRERCYFSDKYQALPEHGYSEMCMNMLTHNNITLYLESNVDIDKLYTNSDLVIYTGNINDLLPHSYLLEYRSVYYKTYEHNVSENRLYLANSVVNTPDEEHITRMVDHKGLNPNSRSTKTVVTHEYKCEYSPDGNLEPAYPIGNNKNVSLYQYMVKQVNKKYGNKLKLLGRLATYSYINMDVAMYEAMKLVNSISDNK